MRRNASPPSPLADGSTTERTAAGRDGGVDRMAAGAEHPDAGLGRQRVRGDDHAAAGQAGWTKDHGG